MRLRVRAYVYALCIKSLETRCGKFTLENVTRNFKSDYFTI